jgi:hypothetical protein
MTDHDLEQRLRAWYRAEIDDRESAPFQLRAELPSFAQSAATTRRALVPGSTLPAMLRFAPLALAAAAVLAIVLVGIGLFVRPTNVGPAPGPANPSAPAGSCAASPAGSPVAPGGWTGPVRSRSASVISMGSSFLEKHDSARGYVDIEQVQVDVPSQPHWRLLLASAPPKATTLDPACTVISYGLTFDTTGDGEADYVVGISNEAPKAGDFRVWVTDLATGDVTEQVGPPYGFPIEFSHPDEYLPGYGAQPAMLFTFLGLPPGGIDQTTKFYAWASIEEDGQLIAWDYAPDAGWLNP